MTHPTPTDAFGRPIHVGDTVVVSARSHTTSPGLINATVTGFGRGGELVHLVVAAVGREQGRASNEEGQQFRRQTGRVQVIVSAAQAADNARVLAEAAAAGLVPEAVAQ
ncbi:hypothetical protein Q8791_23120 [Nocardiopsis sp. CT-R113]|uniref:Uncharacterized protein n=1 Tax=Nocardiopsis codii TaxID=3065942 RepID=A0ABU7KCZ6_9ACTN|nr:hypothetical protein [Nocardiopsis sp. CT-R113]MEE2040113.1 hypothetical protein [Nocardiopsis sp. CT-R113]